MAVWPGTRARVRFVVRAFMGGVDHAGSVWNENRIVGSLLVAGLIVAILGVTLPSVQIRQAFGWSAAIVVIATLLLGLTFDGAYVEANRNRAVIQDSADQEVRTVITALRPEHVAVRGREFPLDEAFLRLGDLLSQGWRLGNWKDHGDLIRALGGSDQKADPDSLSDTPLAIAATLHMHSVVDMQHLSSPPGPYSPFGSGIPPSEIASISPLGIRVLKALRAQKAGN